MMFIINLPGPFAIGFNMRRPQRMAYDRRLWETTPVPVERDQTLAGKYPRSKYQIREGKKHGCRIY